MVTKMKRIYLTPTKKNIELQHSYITSQNKDANITRMTLYYNTLFDLNFNNKITVGQIEELKNKGMINIRIKNIEVG